MTAKTLHATGGFPQSQFLLMQSPRLPNHRDSIDDLPYRETPPPRCKTVIEFPQDELAWIRIGEQTGQPVPAAAGEPAVAGFRVMPGRTSPHLTMFTRSDDVRVNGIKPLGLAVVQTKDCLAFGSGCLCYVTQRITPFVGPPTEEMLTAGQKCPLCKIAFDAETQVISHQCGSAYHFETEISHPHLKPEDRMNCAARVRACLVCTRPIGMSAYLAWDANDL